MSKSIFRIYLDKYLSATDIKDHMPILREYADKCKHITEMGVRGFCSTWAFLRGHPEKLVSIDWNRAPFEICPESLALCREVSKDAGIEYEFITADSLEVEIEQTDLLFIDTWHTYEQLLLELLTHSGKVVKYIAVHDTNADVFPGMSQAIADFVSKNPQWTIAEEYNNWPGLTILKRLNDIPVNDEGFDKPQLLAEVRLQQRLYYEKTNAGGSVSEGWEIYRAKQFERFRYGGKSLL